MSGGTPTYKESTIILDDRGNIAFRTGNPYALAVNIVTMYGKLRLRLKERTTTAELMAAKFAQEITWKWRLSA